MYKITTAAFILALSLGVKSHRARFRSGSIPLPKFRFGPIGSTILSMLPPADLNTNQTRDVEIIGISDAVDWGPL
jgi:hypothetical protein